LVAELGLGGLPLHPFGQPEARPQELGEDPERAPGVPGAPLVDPDAGCRVTEDEVLDEPALADARRPDEGDDARLALLHRPERLVERRLLCRPAHERGPLRVREAAVVSGTNLAGHQPTRWRR